MQKYTLNLVTAKFMSEFSNIRRKCTNTRYVDRALDDYNMYYFIRIRMSEDRFFSLINKTFKKKIFDRNSCRVQRNQ